MKAILGKFAVLAAALLTVSAVASAQVKGQSNYNLTRAYEVLSSDNDLDQALKLIQEQLNLTPGNAEAYLFRARIYYMKDDYGHALSDLNKALKCNKPKVSDIPNSTLHWWKATVYEAVADYELALAEYKTTLALARKEKSKNIQDISFRMGQLLYSMERYDESDAVYKQMIAEDETDCSAMVGLSRNMMAREDYKGMLLILDRAEKFGGDYSEIYRFRMQAYDNLGKTDMAIDDAINYYDKADDPTQSLVTQIFLKHKGYAIGKIKTKVRLSDNPLKWRLLLINLYEDSEDYVKVIEEYDKVEADFGKDESIYYGRAQAYDHLGLYEIALSEVNKSLEMGESSYSTLFKAFILTSLKRYDEAIAIYENLKEENPTFSLMYYWLGSCYEDAGNFEKAIEVFSEGIDVDASSYTTLYLSRASLYRRMGEVEKAKADFEKVVEVDTAGVYGHDRFYALEYLGRGDEAVAWIDKMIEAKPDDSGNWYNKACLLVRMERFDDAMKALEKCLELGFLNFSQMSKDYDMDPIREREDYKALVGKYEAKLAAMVEGLVVKYESSSEVRVTEVPITKRAGGTFNVDCTVNGLSLNMIFDTGASDVSISKVEADFMYKNNYLSREDIVGKQYYMTADGGISEGTIITLKEVKIGDAVLHNVKASVSKSQSAPLLLGESVLQKFGTFTIDNINSKLIIRY